MNILLKLFLVFFKMGIFSFGGGYAMISLLREEAIAYGFLNAKEFSDVVAISQITPGPIAVNMATFVGFREAGVLGSVFATVGVCTPSLILVITLSMIIKKFNESDFVKNAFYGLRPAVLGLIIVAALNIAVEEFISFENIIEYKSIIISIIAFVTVLKTKINPILVIIISAVAGIFIFR